MADIPNTIPSNQLKNPVINQENQESQPCTQDSLFMSQYNEKNRKSFEDLENLSFNLDTTGNNTANNTINEPVNTQQNEEIFDELAMLCSGQFRTETQKKPSQKEQNKKDLYEFEDDDDDDLDEEEKLIKKFRKQKEIEEELDEEEEEKGEEEEEEEVGEEENEEENEISDEEEEEIDEEIEIRDEETRPKSREQKLKIKKKKKEEYKKALEKDGFFEEEAELSGDEKDEDDDYDGDSADDDSIVCSGDEDKNLPSDSELKEQLGRIYLKDKMDEDKRQLRLIKEMYISEKDEKNSRRKNFRWKHIDDNLGVGFHSDSSEQEEDDDHDEDDKKNNFFKSVANGDWRSNRHEREQFVKQNIRKENLLSEDEDEDEEKDEEDADSCLRIFGSSANQPGNQLLKKGQMLLKKKSMPIRPSVSQKRPFEDEKTNQSRIIVQKRVQTKKNDQKFSFLNRDKSYLSRLSNYVNKNLTDKVSFKTVRPNNMIFSVLDSSEPQMNDENKNIQINNSNKQTSLDSNNLESKRAKYDYSQSIFNHL